jgi:hypothetical protein
MRKRQSTIEIRPRKANAAQSTRIEVYNEPAVKYGSGG